MDGIKVWNVVGEFSGLSHLHEIHIHTYVHKRKLQKATEEVHLMKVREMRA